MSNENIKSISKDQQVRRNFVLPNKTVAKIAELSTDMGNTTNSKVVSMSVALLDLVVEANKNGEKVIFQDEDGNTREIAILM